MLAFPQPTKFTAILNLAVVAAKSISRAEFLLMFMDRVESRYRGQFGLLLLLPLVVLLGLAIDVCASDTSDQEIFFESKVRPILVQHCVRCHGPDEQSGGLRLDLQLAVNKGGSSGLVIIAGEPEKSSLVRAVEYHDTNFQMPPDGRLKDEEIAILIEWVRAGAFWPADKDPDAIMSLPPAQRIDAIRESHWAYRPIVRAEPPQIHATNWVQTDIDRFILSKLESKGLEPNPRADRRTLLLRAYFTLIGLPPTMQEVESFCNNDTPQAYEALVDRLLNSRHYGERWARHWLDVARFAETTGYQAGSRDTRYPYAYTYRDYVINAFNDDKPFNQFIIEQLAADHLQLDESQKHRLAGLGFLTVGRKFMGNPHDIIDDQIDVVTRAFLGTSVACARCHDHKYDPIPSADYYSLYGVFASSQEPEELPLIGDPAASPGYSEFLAAKAEKQKEVDDWVEKKRLATEDELRSRLTDYLVHLAKIAPPAHSKDVKRIGERGALRPRAVGRWQNFTKSQPAKDHPVWGLFDKFRSLAGDQFKEQAAKLLSVDDNSLTPFHAKLVEALRTTPPESLVDVAELIGKRIEEAYAKWKEFKQQDPSATRLSDDGEEQLRNSLYDSDNPTTLTTELMISLLDQAERNEYNQQLSKIKTVEITHPGAPGRGMVLVDKPSLYDPAIFRRGQPGNLGDKVPRRFLQLLSHVDGGKPFVKGSGRLELAEAIAHPANPLTARVIVNRIWQYHFGVGLVSTASDFGARGDVPSHPELLDFLADEFMKDGWSIKRLQKRIMMSATWQQSSGVHERGKSIDPENRLVWHMPRRRLEFEPLRDRLLMTTDKLDLTIGGRSVMIHEEANRRGLYAYVDREDIPGLLASFDLPSPDASQATRARTTVPQQALYLINSKFVINQAEALAQKTSANDSVEDRIRALYKIALVREPSEKELEACRDFLERVALSNQEPASSDVELPVWRYGYGSFEEASNQISFQPFPYYTGKNWQVSENFPDAELAYVSLSATGGHPGNNHSRNTIIRWIAPGAGRVGIEGELKHETEQGDGVRARVISSKAGIQGTWVAHNNETKTLIDRIDVNAGDVLNFVVDCRAGADDDSYSWKIRIKVLASPDSELEVDRVWNATREFAKASQSLLPTPKIDPWVQLSHVLLLSNDFAFVD